MKNHGASQCVEDVEKFGKDEGLIHEAVVMGRKVGAGKSFWSLLAHNKELFEKVVKFVETTAVEPIFSLTPNFDNDLQKTGYKLKSDIGNREGEFRIDITELLKEGEDGISGEEIIQRAEDKNALLGQRHAEAMLRNQEVIPSGLREYCLMFPGTVWIDSKGFENIPNIRWDKDMKCWRIFFYWLDNVFSDRDYHRLVCIRK